MATRMRTNAGLLGCGAVLAAALSIVHCASIAAAEGAQAGRDQTEYVGVILDVKGDWNMVWKNSKTPVSTGQAIPNGARIKPAKSPPGKDWKVLSVLVDGRRLVCPGDELCGQPVLLSRVPSPVESWLAAVVDLFSQGPAQWVSPITRGESLLDAVVSVDKNVADVMPVLRQVHPGKYNVALFAVAADGSLDAKSPLTRAVITVEDGKASLAVPNGLSEGVYWFSVMSANNPGERQHQHAVVLLAGPDRYETLRSEFARACSEAEQLAGPGGRDAAVLLKRAYLLARVCVRCYP